MGFNGFTFYYEGKFKVNLLSFMRSYFDSKMKKIFA